MFIVLIATQAFVQNYMSHPGRFTGVVSAYDSGMRPGMQLRLEQRTINSFKRAMETFLPHYFNFDLQFPNHYHYDFGILFDLIEWQIDWTDITYTRAELNVGDTEINFEEYIDKHTLHVKFPAIKHWEINAHEHVNNYILPSDSQVYLKI